MLINRIAVTPKYRLPWQSRGTRLRCLHNPISTRLPLELKDASTGPKTTRGNGELPPFTQLHTSLQMVADRLIGTQSRTRYGERLEQHLSAQAVNFIYIAFLTRPEMIPFR